MSNIHGKFTNFQIGNGKKSKFVSNTGLEIEFVIKSLLHVLKSI